MGSVLLGGTWKMHRIALLKIFMATLISAQLSPDHRFFEIIEPTDCDEKSDRSFGRIKYEGAPCSYAITPQGGPIKFSCKTFNIPQADDGSCPNVMKFEENGDSFQLCGDHFPDRVFDSEVKITVVTTEMDSTKLAEVKDEGGKSDGGKGKKSSEGKREKSNRRNEENKSNRSIDNMGGRRNRRSLPERRNTAPRAKRTPLGGRKKLSHRLGGNRRISNVEGRKLGRKASDGKRTALEKQRKKGDKNNKQNNAFGYDCVWQPEYSFSYFYNYNYYSWYDYYADYYDYDDDEK